MANPKLTYINPLIVDDDSAQTAANCAAVATYVANANFDSESEELDSGHFLILETIAAALRQVENAPTRLMESEGVASTHAGGGA